MKKQTTNTCRDCGQSFRGHTGAYRCALELRRDRKYLVNPGSVGQPRDGRPLAAYAIYDSDTRVLTIHRAAYRIAETQRAIHEAGLPRPLATRLSIGR